VRGSHSRFFFFAFPGPKERFVCSGSCFRPRQLPVPLTPGSRTIFSVCAPIGGRLAPFRPCPSPSQTWWRAFVPFSLGGFLGVDFFWIVWAFLIPWAERPTPFFLRCLLSIVPFFPSFRVFSPLSRSAFGRPLVNNLTRLHLL